MSLMGRAMASAPIIIEYENTEEATSEMYKNGRLSEKNWKKHMVTRDFVCTEFAEVKKEAEWLMNGWGKHVWSNATEMHKVALQKDKDVDVIKEKVTDGPSEKDSSNSSGSGRDDWEEFEHSQTHESSLRRRKGAT